MTRLCFEPQTRIVGCKSLDGAQKLAQLLTERFTGDPQIREHITFHSIIETDAKVSVHAGFPVNDAGRLLLREAVEEFRTRFARGSSGA
jgi:hypothetical protein